MLETFRQKNQTFFSILIIVLVSIPLFAQLGKLPIRDFDEARNSINTLEMYSDGDWVVTHFEGQPDMWNTKPPLLIWLQTLFFKLIGPSELALRLPSAIAALLTCIILLHFATKHLKNNLLGILAVIVLVTTHGYVGMHSARTGDSDTLLTFFLTISTLYFFLFLETARRKYLFVFTISIVLSVLTKGIAGFMILPGLLLCSLFSNKFFFLIKNKEVVLSGVIALILICSYYLLREYYNPGFIHQVWENEIGGRYLSTIENHEGDFSYYLMNLINGRMAFWYFLVPIGAVWGIMSNEFRISIFSKFLVINSLAYFLIISTAKTKCFWYDIPLFPMLSLLTGIALYNLIQIPTKIDTTKFKPYLKSVIILAVLLLFYEPVRKTIKKTIYIREESWEENKYEIGKCLQSAVKGAVDLNDFSLVNAGYPTHLEFYIRLLNEKQVNIKFNEVDQLRKGNRILVHQEEIKKVIQSKFKTSLLFRQNNVEGWMIEGLN
jgi:4-amino-4-deoxy-L-arabinose transferase-like glycosyltransferase